MLHDILMAESLKRRWGAGALNRLLPKGVIAWLRRPGGRAKGYPRKKT